MVNLDFYTFGAIFTLNVIYLLLYSIHDLLVFASGIFTAQKDMDTF